MTHDPVPARPAARTASRPDPLVGILAGAVFVVVILILTLLLYVITTGVLSPPAPRTLAERNLFMLEQVVKDVPESAEAWADYVDASIVAGQLTQAQEIVDRGVAQLGEDVPEIELAQGKVFLAQGQTDEALTQLRYAIEITQEFRASELARLAESGITAPATIIKSEVIAEAAMVEASIHYEREDWSAMIEALNTALAEQPTNADALISRGNAYAELGDIGAARADYEQAMLYIPDYQPARDALDALEGADQ